MARPALPRYRADLVLAIELSAEDATDADARVEALLDQLRPRLEATIRGARVGSSALIHAHALDSSAV